MGTSSYYGITIPDPEPSGAGGALLIDALKVLAKRSDENSNHTHSGYAPLAHTHDGRYYTETEMDGFLAAKAAVGHTHLEADVLDLDKYTTGQVDALILTRSAVGHTHVEADVTDLDKYATATIDAWKLDDWAAPDDNTDLDATVARHGLLPKLGGGTANFLRADGTWAAPPGGGSGGTVQGTDGTYDIQATNDGATDGDARGEYSVDLSTSRSNANMVASGEGAVIGGGADNRVTGDYAVISGGVGNTASGTYSAALGGAYNTAGGDNSVACGFRATDSNYNGCFVFCDSNSGYYTYGPGAPDRAYFKVANGFQIVDGNQSDGYVLTCDADGVGTWQVASGGGSGGSGGTVQGTDHTYDIQATNDGATDGAARGENSVDLSTKRSNTNMVASGTGAVISGGVNNTASGTYSVVGGGNVNVAQTNCFVGGGTSNSASYYMYGYATIAGGQSNSCYEFGFIGGGMSNSCGPSTGFSVVCGGSSNSAGGWYDFVGGGYGNVIGANTSYNIIVGGEGNDINAGVGPRNCIVSGRSNAITPASNGENVICGGNTNSCYEVERSFLGGGFTNAINADYGVLCGGLNNTASGGYSFVGGGRYNDQNSTVGFILSGANNYTGAGGDYSGVLGGYDNSVSGAHSLAWGQQAFADKSGQEARGASQFAARGDAQGSRFMLRRQVTHSDSNWYALYPMGDSGVRLDIAASTSWTFSCLIVGMTANAGKKFAFKVEGIIDRDSSGNTTVVFSTTTIDASDDVSFDARASADDTNESLLIEVSDSDGGSDVVRWVATLETAEVSFAA